MLRQVNEIEETNHLEPRVARLEGELGQLITTVNSLAHSTERFHHDIGIKIDRIAEGNRPDFGLMAQWTSVVVIVIGLIATPIAYHFNRSIEGLDIKLQKEFTLITDTQKERQNSLQTSINELDTRLQREIGVANNWLNERIKGDLEELRIRRFGKEFK